MRNLFDTVLSANDSTTRNGICIDAGQLFSVSFHATFSDSDPGGEFKIQASNDTFNPVISHNVTGVFAPTNWVDIPNQTATIVAGASALLTLDQSMYRWLRAVYIPASGSGATNVSVTANGIGV